MDRYIVFAYRIHSPLGGADDIIGTCNTKDEIADILTTHIDRHQDIYNEEIERFFRLDYQSANVYDTHTKEVIELGNLVNWM